MTSIFESKIYASLSQERKDKVKAAYLNPVNLELVQQLSTYLDAPVENDPELGWQNGADVNNVSEKSKENTKPEVEEGSHSTSSETRRTLPSMNKLVKDLKDEENTNDASILEPSSVENPVAEPAPGSDSSNTTTTTQQPESAEASTAIKASCFNVPEVDLDTIKGTLNAREETTGVTQIRRRENEIWIYYGDKVNLNTILPTTIDLIAYIDPRLEFNRLARSNNAIVFEISCDTTYPIGVKNEKE